MQLHWFLKVIIFAKKVYICYIKFIAKVFLVLFFAFLAFPTLICIIDEESDTSFFYSSSEEEENHYSFDCVHFSVLTNEVFEVFNLAIHFPRTSFVVSDDLLVHNYNLQIFLPPPELP